MPPFGTPDTSAPMNQPFHIGWAHEREVVSEHSMASHKQVLN